MRIKFMLKIIVVLLQFTHHQTFAFLLLDRICSSVVVCEFLGHSPCTFRLQGSHGSARGRSENLRKAANKLLAFAIRQSPSRQSPIDGCGGGMEGRWMMMMMHILLSISSRRFHSSILREHLEGSILDQSKVVNFFLNRRSRQSKEMAALNENFVLDDEADDPTSSVQAEATPPKQSLPQLYIFDADDDFYLAPPTCQLLHYRSAAVLVGIVEILLALGALITSLEFYASTRLVGIWAPLLLSAILCMNICTTIAMVYGIRTEQPQLLWPQIYFLKVEITLLMAGAVFSIASMCLGIESTNWIFSHFVSIAQMEKQFGPIWPFNVGCVFFSGAAIGIWFDVIVRGCYDYLLDKEYFSQGPQPIQIGRAENF